MMDGWMDGFICCICVEYTNAMIYIYKYTYIYIYVCMCRIF